MPKNPHQISNANPILSTPYATTSWFVKKPGSNQYITRAGNNIKLLNCGDEYLPQLHRALTSAKKSIYIAIWGFNPYVQLKLGSKGSEDQIGNVLERMAKKLVEVKVLVWYDFLAQVLSSEDSLQSNWITRSWAQKAMAGEFPNLEFMTRKPGKPVADDDETVREMGDQIEDLRKKWTKTQSLKEKVEIQQAIIKKQADLDLLEKVGHGEYEAQKARERAGIPTASIGSFPTHHQKMILIDYKDSDSAVGFVQGFNLWPSYFDHQSHPFRYSGNYKQDVGLRLKGPCLMDLFYNFKQGWNEAKATSQVWKRISEVKGSPPTLKSKGIYTAQILRTWRNHSEYDINKFYEQAFANINNFIFVEDQYFRQPEFARFIKKRAEFIDQKSQNKKKLYVFAITNLNASAFGEADVRAKMVEELNRSDTNVSEADWQKTQADEKRLAEIKAKMEKSGAMVHICRLMNYGIRKGRITYPSYKEIYVHSKLTIFDGAYLTLGSANWNQRSMKGDTELNIAIQFTDNKAHEFREKIWLAHTNGQWKKEATPKKWYKNWEELLADNSKQYFRREPLTMNLFPYFEDLGKLKGITNVKQQYG